MKGNYVCTEVFECDYTTARDDNLKIKELNQIVEQHGGYVCSYGTCCPKCRKNSLVYESENK